MGSLHNLLKKNSVKGVFHTHVRMGAISGKYQFNRQTLETFWGLYQTTLLDDSKSFLNIAEKAQQYLPVLGDIDIKIMETDDLDIIGDELHTEIHTNAIIEIYQSVLRKIVENCTDKHLICVLLEKPLYRVTKNGVTYAKHGFHIHFPYCFLSKTEQEIHLIPRVQEMARNMKVFEDLGFEDSGNLIDKSCCSVPWLLYGSVKDEGLDPYLVSKIYNSEGDEIELEEAFREYQIFDMSEKLINIKGKISEYLPRILSILPYNREVSEIKRGLMSPLKEKMKETKKNNNEYQTRSLQERLNIAKKLLPMLADFRAEDRQEWLTVGWVLYNIGDGCPEAMELWCEFSSRCEEKYDEAVCIYNWERMVKKSYTLATLRHFANKDNSQMYSKFKNEECAIHTEESLAGSHNDIAKALKAEYGDEFVCVSITSKTWYQFVGHVWEMIEEGIFLREKISNQIVEKFTKMGQKTFQDFGSNKDKSAESMFNTRIDQIKKMVAKCKQSPFKTNVMKEACEVFYDKRFREKLDTNSSLFPFKNGVYDLSLNIFRAGRPEDFISKCAPINYREFRETDVEVQQVYDFFLKVFPDKSVRTYFMDVSSDIFYGGNSKKHVYFWTGEGDNAKSVTQSLFEKMLGKLAIKFNTTVITGKKVQSGSANPELARAGGGVRLAVLEEPNDDEMVNGGIMKNLSGNDSYYARDLFEKGKEGREITPMFKIFFICNKLPKIRGSDKAVWNRIRVIPFESTFCRDDDPAPESFEEQLRQKRFPMDNNFNKKIPGMLEAFAWVLLEHRKKTMHKTQIEPEKVRVATAIYRRQNDIYRQFVEECITESKESILNLNVLYTTFKEWFRDSLPHHTVPIKNEIGDYFTKLWGDPERGKKWKGYRIRTLQDDIEKGDAIVLGDEDLIDYSEKSNLPPI